MTATKKKGDGKNGAPAEDTAAPQATVAPKEEAYLKSLERAQADDEVVQIVSFFLNSDEYAFEVYDAVEVLKPREVTGVPQVPSFILGVLSVRGEMVPVVDLKGRLGIEAGSGSEAASRILVAGVDDLRAGFMVDRMGAVKDVKTRSIKLPQGKTRFLKGTIRSRDAGIDILDIAKLLDI